jgi:hypothetical protein
VPNAVSLSRLDDKPIGSVARGQPPNKIAAADAGPRPARLNGGVRRHVRMCVSKHSGRG